MLTSLFGRPGARIALVATIAALAAGGVAYATIPDSAGTIHGCVYGAGSLRIIDPDLGAACREGETRVDFLSTAGKAGAAFTEVFSGGGINDARSKGAISVAHLGTGVYRVTFDRDLSTCTFFVSTPYNSLTIGNASQFFQDTAASVTVIIFDLDVVPFAHRDTAFDLAALC